MPLYLPIYPIRSLYTHWDYYRLPGRRERARAGKRKLEYVLVRINTYRNIHTGTVTVQILAHTYIDTSAQRTGTDTDTHTGT